MPSALRRRLFIARVLGLAAVVALAVVPSSVVAGGPSWEYSRASVAPLINARQWILQGTKQPNGSCRYTYPAMAGDVPASGWIVRSIAVDAAHCRKLFEEGAPTKFSRDPDATIETASTGAPAAAGAVAAAASTKQAWVRVIWRDFGGVLTNAVMVQTNWTYNGTTVSGGSTNGAWQLNTATKWQLIAKTLTDLYGAGSVFYRGQATATFYNDYFCDPWPPVHTYYYYVRMWGHYNGTATYAQSSDTVDECLTLHVDIERGYGPWPG